MRLSNKLIGQGYIKERLKSSLRKFYGRYGDLTKQYEIPLSRMLHDILDDDHIQWHPPLIGHYTNFWPLLIWTLLPNLTFCLIVQGFHRTYATGAACQQRTLTPRDTWSCPTLGLACVLMSRPISPELVLSPDFWISNTPRYFSFAFDFYFRFEVCTFGAPSIWKCFLRPCSAFSPCTSSFSPQPLLALSMFFIEFSLYMSVLKISSTFWGIMLNSFSDICLKFPGTSFIVWNKALPSSIIRSPLSCAGGFAKSIPSMRYFISYELSVFAKQSSAVPILNGTDVRGYCIRSPRSICISGLWDWTNNCIVIFPCCLYSTILVF